MAALLIETPEYTKSKVSTDARSASVVKEAVAAFILGSAVSKIIEQEQKKLTDSSPAYGQSLGSIMVSAVAMSLHQLLEIYAIVTKLEQETYNLQQNSIKFMAKAASQNAKMTYDALCNAASSMRFNAIGSLTSSTLTVGGELKGLHSFSNGTTKLNPVTNRMTAMETNRNALNEGLHPVVPKPVGKGVAGELKTVSKAKAPGLSDQEYFTTKAKVEAQIARHETVEADDITNLANTKYEDTLKIKKNLDTDYSTESNEKRSIETDRDNDVMKWRSIGQGFGGLLSGSLQTAGAQSKAAEAEAEALKADAQTAQTITQGILERQGQGINSFDSARQAISQAQSEMSASNRV